jgi:hypothetical protein
MRKTIESDRLLDNPIHLRPDDTVRFGERELPITTQTIIALTDTHTQQIEDGVFKSLRAFGAQERTLALALVGLPTLVARADCTIHPDTGDIHLFEAEERPAGMGVTDAIGQRVAERKFGASILGHMEQILGLPPIVKRHADVLENDDSMLMPVEVFSAARMKIRPEQPILVRAEPHQMTGHPRLQDATTAAIAPILEKGKRAYRVATGHATLLTNPQALSTDESVVLKTLQGSKAKGVMVSLSQADTTRYGDRDTVTRTKARHMVEREGGVIMERFVPGIPVDMNVRDMGHMILRVFCLVDREGARAIGGTFLARPGHLVHGSRDAVAGLVLAPENEGA